MTTGNERSAPSAERVVHSSPFGVVCFTQTGSVAFANRRMEGILGYRPGEMVGKKAEDIDTDGSEGEVEGVGMEDVGVEEIVRGYAGSSSYPPETPADTELLDKDGDCVPVTVVAETVETEEGRYVTLWVYERTGLSMGEKGYPNKGEGNGNESTRGDTNGSTEKEAAPEESRQDTSALETLTEVGCELSCAGTEKEVADVCLEAAERLLGSEVVCVRYFDEETNSLDTVATTERAKKMTESRRAFNLDRSGAGRALRHGEPVVDRQGTRDSAASLHVPLGERGTLTAFRTATDDPIETEIGLARRLGSLVEANLERLESGAVSGRGADADGNDPEHLRRIHGLVRETVEGVAKDGTHEGLGQRVCDLLAGSDRYREAWFLDVDGGGKSKVEASSGGVGVSGVPDAVKETEEGESAVKRAIETGEVSFVSRQQRVGTAATEAQREEEMEFVVPLSYGERTYSVLVVSTAAEDGVEKDADSPNSLAHAELRILKDVLGLGIYATKNRELLLSEKVMRLEFEVTDPGCLAVTVSEDAGCYCEIEHSTLTNEGNPLVYMKVEGAPPDDVCEATESADSVVECRPVETSDDGGVIEVVKSRSGAEVMTDVGATVTSATAEEGVGSLVVEAPPSADVHEIVEAYRDLNPDSRLVSKREVDRPTTRTGAFGEGVDEALTERQSSVLKTAYYAGYYDWPRGSTAEDIAESLGISPATFHQHIRKAERETVGFVCDLGD